MEKYNTHGGYFSPGLIHIGAGGTHEQNPNQGVQIGTDSQGIPNLVEEGENIYEDYVFSDRLKPTAAELKEFLLPEKYAGKTFAKIAEKLSEEASNRPNDSISSNGMGSMLDRLMACQEEHKRKDTIRELQEELDNMSPEELAMLQEQLDQSEMASEWQPQVQTAQQMPVQQMPVGQAIPEQAPMQYGMYADPAAMQQPFMASYGGFLPNYFAGGGYSGDDDEYDGGPISASSVSAALDRAKWLDLVQSGKVSIGSVPAQYRPWIEGETSQFRRDIASAGNDFIDSAVDFVQDLDRKSNLHLITEPTVDIDGIEVPSGGGSGALELVGNPTGAGLKQMLRISKAGKAVAEAASTERKVKKGLSILKKGAEKTGKLRTIAASKQAAVTEAALTKEAYEQAGQEVSDLQKQVNKLIKDGKYKEARDVQDKLNKAGQKYIETEQAAVKAEKNANKRRPKMPEAAPEAPAPAAPQPEGSAAPVPSGNTPPNTSWLGRRPTWQKIVFPIAGLVGAGAATGAIIGAHSGKGTVDDGYADELVENIPASTETNGYAVSGYSDRNYKAEGGPIVRKYDPAYNISSVLGTGNTSYFNVYGDKWHPKSGLMAKGADYLQQAARNAGLLKDYRVSLDENTGNWVFAGTPQSTGHLRIGNGPYRWSALNIPYIQGIDWSHAQFPEDVNTDFRDDPPAAGTGYGGGYGTGNTPISTGPASTKPVSFSPKTVNDAAAIFEAMRNLDLNPGNAALGTGYPQYGTYRTARRLPTMSRYAGAAGNIIGGIINAGRDADHVNWGQYYPAHVAGNLSLQDVRYVPNDFRQTANEIGAQSNATRSAIQDSGAGPSTGAALVANGYNANMGLGNGFWQTQLANLTSRNQAVTQNNQAEQAMQDFAFRRNLYNTNIDNQAAKFNKQLYMDQAIRNIGFQNDKWNAVSSMLDAGLTDLSNIGRENFTMNQINSNSALYYGVGPDGWAYYKGYDGIDRKVNPTTGETKFVIDKSQIPAGTAKTDDIPADFMPGSLPSVRAARWAREKGSYVPAAQEVYEPVYTKRGVFGETQDAEDPYWWAVRCNGGKLKK